MLNRVLNIDNKLRKVLNGVRLKLTAKKRLPGKHAGVF
jgi:hypothetical protein